MILMICSTILQYLTETLSQCFPNSAPWTTQVVRSLTIHLLRLCFADQFNIFCAPRSEKVWEILLYAILLIEDFQL